MATDPSGMFKDLISTVEEKVNKPLAKSTGKLTSEFFSDPSATRSRLGSTELGQSINPLEIDRLVGQRRGNIAGQIAGNEQLAGSNADLIGNFFNFISQMAEQSRLSRASSAGSQPSYSLEQTAEGLRAYDPTTGKFVGGVLGQAPAGNLSATELKAQQEQQLNQVFADLRDDIANGKKNIQELARTYPELTTEEIQAEVKASDTRTVPRKIWDLLNPFG